MDGSSAGLNSLGTNAVADRQVEENYYDEEDEEDSTDRKKGYIGLVFFASHDRIPV
jgi:hypothetical protein